MAASLELDKVALPDLVRAVDDIFVVAQSVYRLLLPSELIVEWISESGSERKLWLIKLVSDFLRGFIILDCLSKGQSISLWSDNFLVLEVRALTATASDTMEVRI